MGTRSSRLRCRRAAPPHGACRIAQLSIGMLRLLHPVTSPAWHSSHRVGAQTAEEERVCRVRTRSLVSHVPRPTAPGAGAARPQPPCMQPQLRCCRTAPVVALTRDRRGCAGRAPRRSDEAHRARREAALGRTSPPCERALTRRGVPCAAPGRSPCAWPRAREHAAVCNTAHAAGENTLSKTNTI